MSINNQIKLLNDLGQSIWYDNLSKDVLANGELKKLIDSGVSGLTSNPTIFKNAIADSSSYDSEISEMAKKGISTDDICEDLMIEDVGKAADLLLETYNKTGGADGHASIEVSPFLAEDEKGTIEAAKRIWSKLNRPNIMIKIPATNQCISAIKAVLEEGINVNVTLIFSVEVYSQVAESFISALENRVSKGLEIKNIASVASFFVSRVDAICEKKFDELLKTGSVKESDKEIFFGKIGIANSKLAYKKYEELFMSSRFQALKAKGAREQRPLWASTGTKNPVFSPVMYIEELAGHNTVNTVPPATLKALLEKANINGAKIKQSWVEAESLISKTQGLGLKFDDLLLELQDAGVKSFSDSFKDLLASIENKRAKFA